MKRTLLKTIWILLLAPLTALTFTGCGDTGDELEDAGDETLDAVDEAADEAADAVEEAADEVEDEL